MTQGIPPGFEKYLKRTHKEEFAETPKRETIQQDAKTEGDWTVVDVKNSSNIKQLRYNEKTKWLFVVFVHGGEYPHKEIEKEEFEAVAHPGEAHQFSVGKAYHAVIKLKAKPHRNDGIDMSMKWKP